VADTVTITDDDAVVFTISASADPIAETAGSTAEYISRLEVTTPSADLRCSVGPEPAGDATCFGFRFTDLRWDETTITLVLTEPFVDAPFEQIEVAVSRAGDEVWREIVDVDAGEAERPNGPDCPGACWRATAAATL